LRGGEPSEETSAMAHGSYNSQRYTVYFSTGITADVAVMDKITTTFRFQVTPWGQVTFRSP
jgi:hypothetical protein